MTKPMNHYGKNMLSMLGTPFAVKTIAIGALTLLLLIPATMIESLIQERENRQKEVVAEISSKWGREQTIIGPVISVPHRLADGIVHYLHFLPDSLHITGQVHPQVRYRGIFEAALYNAQLELTGSFSGAQTEKLAFAENEIDWSGASISLGISDIRGISEPIAATVNGSKILMNPGLASNDLMSSGVSAGMGIDRQIKEKPKDKRKPGREKKNRNTRKEPENIMAKNYSFRFVVNLNGSDRINFVPVGKTTTVSLSSKWMSPSFGGAYLPSERSVSEKGFTATWKVLDLNRDYPQHWIGTTYRDHVASSSFGVGLFIPVDFYQKSTRSAKYAILFVALTFVAFLISELAAKVRLHPLQYLLIGLAIITFYTLLLSLSEHISFGTAYAISSVAVIVLVASYAKSILKTTKLAIIVGGILAMVYGYSYWLLQMADYALVAGSVGLFIALSAIMFLTRNIDWYSIKVGSRPEVQSAGSEDRKKDGYSDVLPEG